MADRRSGTWDRRAAIHHGPIVGCECQDHYERPERRVDAAFRERFEAKAHLTWMEGPFLNWAEACEIERTAYRALEERSHG